MSGPNLQDVVEQMILGNMRTPFTAAAHLQQQTPLTSDGSFIDDSVRKQTKYSKTDQLSETILREARRSGEDLLNQYQP